MTATPKKLTPKPVRNNNDSQSKPVIITKQRDFTHKEPIIIPSHLEDVPVISAASYIKDARNRWFIHNVELQETWEVHVNLFNKVKPHVLSAHDYVVNRYQEMMSKD